MIDEEKISNYLDNMEALAKTILSEAAKGRRMLNVVKKEKVSEVALRIQKRKISFYKNLNKKALYQQSSKNLK
jgi:hypothetical protein